MGLWIYYLPEESLMITQRKVPSGMTEELLHLFIDLLAHAGVMIFFFFPPR